MQYDIILYSISPNTTDLVIILAIEYEVTFFRCKLKQISLRTDRGNVGGSGRELNLERRICVVSSSRKLVDKENTSRGLIISLLTPIEYKINLLGTRTYRCLRICSKSTLLQSSLFDLKNSLLGFISYNVNDVLNKHRASFRNLHSQLQRKFYVIKVSIAMLLPHLTYPLCALDLLRIRPHYSASTCSRL